MVISFDLDDTIIPGTKRFETEKQTLIQRIWGIEKMRKGTTALMRSLQRKGHRVFVYTTSHRSPRKIWWMFYLHGIKLGGVVNQSRHERTLKDTYKNYSKYPPAFDIDIHIDDSPGVGMEGERFNFSTIIVAEDNQDWVAFISDGI